MAFRSLFPIGPVRSKESEMHPLVSMQQEMNRLFDNFFGGFEPSFFRGAGRDFRGFVPQIEMEERDNEIVLTAELPGMDEKDIDITLRDNVLVMRGEKRGEFERKEGKEGRYTERSYGSFQRVVPLTAEIDEDKVDATFKNGVVTIHLPKTEDSTRKSRKISLRNG